MATMASESGGGAGGGAGGDEGAYSPPSLVAPAPAPAARSTTASSTPSSSTAAPSPSSSSAFPASPAPPPPPAEEGPSTPAPAAAGGASGGEAPSSGGNDDGTTTAASDEAPPPSASAPAPAPALAPAPAPASPAPAGGGLFAGLSLSRSGSGSEATGGAPPPAPAPAAAAEADPDMPPEGDQDQDQDEAADEERAEEELLASSRAATPTASNATPGGGSRASTPVHSNAQSPPATPSAAGGAGTPKHRPVLVRPSPRMATVTVPSLAPSSSAARTRSTPSTPVDAGEAGTGGPSPGGGATAAGGTSGPPPPPPVPPVVVAPPAGRIRLVPSPPFARVARPDAALRLLRKFYRKTSPAFPKSAGGTRPSTWFGWVFGDGADAGGSDDDDLEVYRELFDALEPAADDEGGALVGAADGGGGGGSDAASGGRGGEDDVVVESVLGRRGDSPAKARKSVAAFVQLVATWGRSSAEAALLLRELEREGKGAAGTNVMGPVTDDAIAMGIDCASALIAHGCLDDFCLKLDRDDEGDADVDNGSGEDEPGAPSLVKRAANCLVESVCAADLREERSELSALKFLLTAGCRASAAAGADVPAAAGASEGGEVVAPAAPEGEPLLRGNHLLQAIRVCSQIYLRTDSESNRTTAKAALQQLVVTVFVRLERSIERRKVEDEMMVEEGGTSPAPSPGAAGAVASSAAGRKRTESASSTTATAAVTFPTRDHRDAYLVLRSLCKLSMQTSRPSRPPPTAAASSAGGEGTGERGSLPSPPPPPPLDAGSAPTYDPALESRILALELLVHVLQHPAAASILDAGPQFHHAVRQHLCASLLRNTTSPDASTAELSLRLFVPVVRRFRRLLKTEVEAFVTNVFFVILDSKNSAVQHKLLVVTLFEEVCGDPDTLAEIFLNYDCDLSAVDLFSRIVNALGRVARIGLEDAGGTSTAGIGGAGGGVAGTLGLVAGAGAVRAEMARFDHRELRLAAMKALRQVLASLHSSIVAPANGSGGDERGDIEPDEVGSEQTSEAALNGKHRDVQRKESAEVDGEAKAAPEGDGRRTVIELYDSKKRRREEESVAALKFNQKPADGLAYAASCGHVDDSDPADVARYLLQNRDNLDKAQIGEYLGREKEWRDGFALRVLRAYGDALDLAGMEFDDAIRYYLSGFRLPGEAQKIDRIMEVFAARYTDQNPAAFPTADSAFILAFSIIMLNTDLHNPAIKEDRKMTIDSFARMNSGVCDGGDFPREMLEGIFGRIQANPISLKEDDEARESVGAAASGAKGAGAPTVGLGNVFFGGHYVEQDRTRESNYQKEGDQIVRDTESMLRRRRKAARGHHHGHGHAPSGVKKTSRDSIKRHVSVKFVGTADSGLRDEYVAPMFDVAWGPALAVFSTAIESANGTDGTLASIATDEEMDHAVDNAALAIDVCLNGFQLAICIAGLCGNDTARDAYVRAMYNFTLLGSGHLLADRHVQCVRSLLQLGRDDGELLGVTWEHIFRALTEIYRLHQVWEGMARNERKEIKARERAARKASKEALQRSSDDGVDETDEESDASSELSDWNDVHLEEEMDKRMIDEANAMFIHDAFPLELVDSIFQRSTALSRRSLNDFVYQLCRVSRMEISGYGGHVGSNANDIDLTNDHYMKHHALSSDSRHGTGAGVGATQPAIYSLEKLVEVTHFNMESRPRLIFADVWGTVSTHLTSTALHEEPAVAMYAVDSLRQLAQRFLNREELGVFEFQRRFLRPLEAIMERSAHVSVKELLLFSVEQLISIYGFEGGDGGGTENFRKGMLRSGWRSVLVVLGTAGLDKDNSIALQGFEMLNKQMQHCMSVCNKADGGSHEEQPGSLLSEYFVDLVNTLLLYVSGPRQDLSSKASDHIVQLANVLAGGKVPLSSTRRKASPGPVALPGSARVEAAELHSDELELWWPMLLGLSQTMGDRRPEVRVKGLGTLLSIINKHFFPSSGGDTKVSAGSEEDSSPRHGDLQTLQLIFRGILVPSLEFEEIDGNSTSGFAPELLPPKFVHFITHPTAADAAASGADSSHHEWINSTFEQLMDGCVSICLRSLEAFDSDSLVEEVLAMLNSCLLSDSGHLAVKGLRRLQQFVSKDLELKDITDDTWATVSHMLFRVLSIRGLPPSSVPEIEGATDEQKDHMKQEHEEAMNEFIREQKYFSNRRYIGCNATMVIGSLLTDEKIAERMGVQWYIFLTSGLGKGIRDWERAAGIIDSHTPKGSKPETSASPPHYLENVLYARRWVTKFIISLLSQRDTSTLETAPCQHVLKEETESLLRGFLVKESSELCSAIEMRNICKMVSDLLDCFNALSDSKISSMKWLSPILSSCIQTNNVTIRTSVQILLTRLLKEVNSTSVTNGNAPPEDADKE